MIKSVLIFDYLQKSGNPANNSNFFREFHLARFGKIIFFFATFQCRTLKATLIIYRRSLGYTVEIPAIILAILD